MRYHSNTVAKETLLVILVTYVVDSLYLCSHMCTVDYNDIHSDTQEHTLLNER